MSDDYEVGYKKPPKKTQFGPGNRAAAGRGKRSKDFSMPEILGRALNRTRKIKRGDRIVSMKASDIMVERFVSMMTTGSARDLVMMIGLIEKYAPHMLEQPAMKMMVTYHQAEGSSVPLPPPRRQGGDK